MYAFFALLPIYLFGNLHCIGMCGPLVMMLGSHRFRFFYFLGRILSFTLAGAIAGGFGAVLHEFFKPFHFSAGVCFFFGAVIFTNGILVLFRMRMPLNVSKFLYVEKISQAFSTLLLKDSPFRVFLFGVLTLALPCGQTVIVYASLALEANFWTGLFNGFAFALFTSPSLFFAMSADRLFKRGGANYHVVLGLTAVAIGLVAILRGLACCEVIEHVSFVSPFSSDVHLALY